MSFLVFTRVLGLTLCRFSALIRNNLDQEKLARQPFSDEMFRDASKEYKSAVERTLEFQVRFS